MKIDRIENQGLNAKPYWYNNTDDAWKNAGKRCVRFPDLPWSKKESK